MSSTQKAGKPPMSKGCGVVKQLDTIQKELTALETVLADNSLYEQAQKDQLKQHLSKQSELLQQQAQLEETWLNSLEELEALQSELEANL